MKQCHYFHIKMFSSQFNKSRHSHQIGTSQSCLTVLIWAPLFAVAMAPCHRVLVNLTTMVTHCRFFVDPVTAAAFVPLWNSLLNTFYKIN